MKTNFSKEYKSFEGEILNFIHDFNEIGTPEFEGQRNEIKVFNFGKIKINIKSFKIPNAINKIAYRFFRKSKAERSFEYAQSLISKNIGTPHPIAFAENKLAFTFLDSYYVCEHLKYDLTFRELIHEPEYPDHEKILRAFTRFTFKMHEQEIEFLDHSPGNTLIQLNNGDYKFFLVDLNRMNFKKMNFDARMRNFHRITPSLGMARIMANEYATLISEPEEKVFERMSFYIERFQRKAKRKKNIKNMLKFR